MDQTCALEDPHILKGYCNILLEQELVVAGLISFGLLEPHPRTHSTHSCPTEYLVRVVVGHFTPVRVSTSHQAYPGASHWYIPCRSQFKINWFGLGF